MKAALLLVSTILLIGPMVFASPVAEDGISATYANPSDDSDCPDDYVWVWDPITESWVKVPVGF